MYLLFVSVLAVAGGLSGRHLPLDGVDPLEDIVDGAAPPLFPLEDNSLEELLEEFDAYHELRSTNDDDWADLVAVRRVLDQKRPIFIYL